jgi:hypothetical protein
MVVGIPYGMQQAQKGMLPYKPPLNVHGKSDVAAYSPQSGLHHTQRSLI